MAVEKRSPANVAIRRMDVLVERSRASELISMVLDPATANKRSIIVISHAPVF
jgi:hypothetical protein